MQTQAILRNNQLQQVPNSNGNQIGNENSEVEILMGHNTYHHKFTEPVLKSAIAGRKMSNMKDSNNKVSNQANMVLAQASPMIYHIAEWQD